MKNILFLQGSHWLHLCPVCLPHILYRSPYIPVWSVITKGGMFKEGYIHVEICMGRNYTVIFDLSFASSSANIIQNRRLHNYHYTPINIHQFSFFVLFPTGISYRYEKPHPTQTSGLPQQSNCTWQPHFNQRTSISPPYSYSKATDIAQFEGDAINVHHDEDIRKRAGTLPSLGVQNIKNSAIQSS